MNRTVASFLSLVTYSLLTGPTSSHACIGGGKVDIGFRRDVSGDVIVSLKSDADGTREILDDTGFISMNLAAVHLVKAAREKRANGTLDGAKYKAVVQFLKTRAEVFRKTYNAASSYPAADKARMNEVLAELITEADKPLIKGREVEAKLDELSQVMYRTKLNITAASRNAGATAWAPEQPIRQLDLPEAQLTRGLSCNVDTAFDPNIGAMPTASAGALQLPSNGVK